MCKIDQAVIYRVDRAGRGGLPGLVVGRKRYTRPGYAQTHIADGIAHHDGFFTSMSGNCCGL